MATSDRPTSKPGAEGTDPNNRSDNLLPTDGTNEDGRFEVAEEINLDQQSDATRGVGQASPGGVADSIPEGLKTPVPSQPVPEKK